MESFEIIAQVEVGRLYQFEPIAISNNTCFEFQADITIQIDLDDMQIKHLPAIPGISRASFCQIKEQLMLLQNGVLMLVNLMDLELHTVALLPFDIPCASLFLYQRKIGIAHQDDLYLVDLSSNEMVASKRTVDSQICLPTEQGILFLQDRSAGILSDEQVFFIKRFRGSVQKALPLVKADQIILVDDHGMICSLGGDFGCYFQNIENFRIQGSKKPPTINFITNRDRYEIFSHLMNEYISHFEDSSQLVKTEHDMLICCSKITELIRAVNIREVSKMKTDTKRRILEIIKQSMSDYNLREMEIQKQIQQSQTHLRSLTERICEKKQLLAELSRDDPDFEMKKFMHQMEQFKVEQKKLIDEEKKNKSGQSNLAELAKQKLKERFRQIEEKRLIEEQEKQKLNEIEQITRALQEQDIKRQKLEEQRLLEEKKEQEEAKKRLEQEEKRKRREEEELQRQIEREREQLLKQKQKELEEQRRKEIEQDKTEKKASKKNVDVHEFELLSHGVSATFIINQQEAIIRQGFYLMKLNFLIYRMETLQCISQYDGQPCAFFQGRYYEFGESGFVVNVGSFEKEETELFQMNQKVVGFCQQREKIAILFEQNLQIVDLTKQKAVFEAEKQFKKVFLLEKLVFATENEAYELNQKLKSFEKIEFKPIYNHKQVRVQDQKEISINENKLYVNGEPQFTSLHTLENGLCCCAGKYIMLVDEQGVFVTVKMK